MKKLIMMTLALVVALSLAACSSNKTSGMPSSTPESATPIPTTQSSDAAPTQSSEQSESIPEEYIGQWEGSTGDISLSFNVDADGSGVYTFEQSGYVESYDFTLEVGTETFSVQIPADNKLGIVICEGTYQYANGVMTLDIQTTFSNGRVFEYSVPCQKV